MTRSRRSVDLKHRLDLHAIIPGRLGHSDLSQVMEYALSDEECARAGVAKL
jgi:hypothetical protein